MEQVDSCIVCGSQELAGSPAIVAPFVREYALGGTGQPTAPAQSALMTCASCDMVFFDQRYDEEEIAALYAGYRSERYYTIRHRFEPLYTRKLNDVVGRESEVIDRRKRKVKDLVTSVLGEGVIRSVLDFGGDAGQFIPDIEGADRYVLEVSDVPPVPGVMSVSHLEDLKEPVDLVMVAHVLEHLSDPVALLQELTSVSGDDGHLYVEVPMDRPRMPPAYAARLQASWVDMVSRSARCTVVADAVSTPVRVLARGRWIPFTFPRLHEHINFFSQESLRRALDLSGWQVVGQVEYKHRSGLLAVPVLGMLAHRRVSEGSARVHAAE